MSKFNTSNAANSIVNIIQTSIGNAAFDTTIRAIVQEKVDEATGKFKLQYQDGLFYAFADDVKVNYSKGTEVFVLVPKNDFTQDKRIIGSVKTLGENYAKVYSEDERYRKIGASAFGEENGTFGIKSKSKNLAEQSLVLYSVNGVVPDEIDPMAVPPLNDYFDANFLNYLKQDGVDGIWLEAAFTTDNLEWVENANYGLTVTFNVKDESVTGSAKTLDLAIDANNMVGNPFSLYNERQIVVFGLSEEATIDFSHIAGIKSVSLWSKDFTAPVDENNIFVKDIKMYAVSAISETQLDAPNAEIWTKNGTYIGEDQGVPLQAQLKIKGKVQTDVKYFWFEEDLSINKDSGADYHVYGGRGWKLLNTTAPNSDGTFKIEETDKNILWVYDNTGSSTETNMVQTQLDIPKRLYKCVIAKSDSERYEAIVEVTNSKISSYSYVIKRVITQGAQPEYKDVEAPVSLQENDEFVCVVTDGNETNSTLQTNVSWYKKDLFDTEWSPIEGVTDQLEIKYADITTQKQIRAMVNGVMTQTVTLIAEAKIPDPTPQYQLVIVNTDQTFVYDENGRSPTHPAKTFKENEPKPLSFKLYDTYAQGNGYDITNQIQEFKWEINSSGLINPITNGEQSIPDDGWTGSWNQLNFTLKDAWSYDTVDNQITLTVKYADATITAKTNFTFLKQGDPGTNGTDVAVVIRKEIEDGAVHYYADAYKGVDLIRSVHGAWYRRKRDEESAISDNADDITLDPDLSVNEMLICEYDGLRGYYVADYSRKEEQYRITKQPSKYIVYDSDGKNPSFVKDYVFEYQDGEEWKKCEAVYYRSFQSSSIWQENFESCVPNEYTQDLVDLGGLMPVAVGVRLEDSSYLHIGTVTLYAHLNRHAFSMVNGWDGNLKVDEDNSAILAQSLIAGKKDINNTFTGIMAGTLSNKKSGFFAFAQGKQTVFINAEDGSTILGPSDKPLLSIGSAKEEFIQSSNYGTDTVLKSYKATDSKGATIIIPKDKATMVTVQANGLYTVEYNETEYIDCIPIYRQGMKIDLKKGDIYAPGYSIVDGSATFEGAVKADSGEFNKVTIASNCYLKYSGDNGQINVGQMLNSLNSKIENLQAVKEGGKVTLSWTDPTLSPLPQTVDFPEGGKMTNEEIAQALVAQNSEGFYKADDGKVYANVSGIITALLTVKYNGSVAGQMGPGYGDTGSGSTYGVMLKGGNSDNGGYLLVTANAARLTSATDFTTGTATNSFWVTSKSAGIDIGKGCSWKVTYRNANGNAVSYQLYIGG